MDATTQAIKWELSQMTEEQKLDVLFFAMHLHAKQHGSFKTIEALRATGLVIECPQTQTTALSA